MYARPLALLDEERCTIHAERRILIVANGELVLMRLANLARSILADMRLQVVFTIPVPRFRCSTRLEELVTRLRLPYLSWDRAVREHFDLAISSSALEELPDLTCPMLILSHGPGHTKAISLASRSATHEDWLSRRRENRPYREILLASIEERGLFPDDAACAFTAVGDVEFDALLASRGRRPRFRDALGTGDRTLVTLSSTWHDNSLFGRSPRLVEELLATFPANRYCFALILHPSVWITHGEWQVETWLRNALRAGLRLIPYDRGWHAAVLAADRVIGDFGSVSLYSNMLDIPTCFYRISEHDVNPELTVVREALGGRQARGTQDVLDFIGEGDPTPAPGEDARRRAFANLGHAAESLARVVYQRIGLPYDAGSVGASFVEDPDVAFHEPGSFHVCLEGEGEARALLYPASLRPPRHGGSVLISTEAEGDYRICQAADGALLDGDEAFRWWGDRFPTATHALIRTGRAFALVSRRGALREVGVMTRDEALALLAGAIASEGASPS